MAKEAEVRLDVQEFHYSEEYHFHTVAQVGHLNFQNRLAKYLQLALIANTNKNNK